MSAIAKTRPVDFHQYLGRTVAPRDFAGLVDIAAKEVAAKNFSVNLRLFWNHLWDTYEGFESTLQQKEIVKLAPAYNKLCEIWKPLEDYRLSLQKALARGTLPTIQPVEPKKEEGVQPSTIAETVIAHKREKVEEADHQTFWWDPFKFKEKSHPALWFADVTEIGFLAYEGGLRAAGIESVGIPAIDGLGLGFSILGGLFYILTGFIVIANAKRATKNNDALLKMRMWAMGVLYIGIGCIILLTELLKYVGLGGFFAANPWLLPALFFIPCIVNLMEVSKRLIPYAQGKDLVSRLNLQGALKILNSNDANWKEALLEHLKAFDLSKFDQGENMKQLLRAESRANNPREIMRKRAELLGQKMEDFQMEIGVRAGLEAFELMILLLKLKEGEEVNEEEIKNEIRERIQNLDAENTRWWRIQKLRFLQQAFVFCFFIATMTTTLGPYSHQVQEQTFGRIYLAMAVQRTIPTYLDAFCPFERNDTLVVNRADDESVFKDLPALASS